MIIEHSGIERNKNTYALLRGDLLVLSQPFNKDLML